MLVTTVGVELVGTVCSCGFFYATPKDYEGPKCCPKCTKDKVEKVMVDARDTIEQLRKENLDKENELLVKAERIARLDGIERKCAALKQQVLNVSKQAADYHARLGCVERTNECLRDKATALRRELSYAKHKYASYLGVIARMKRRETV